MFLLNLFSKLYCFFFCTLNSPLLNSCFLVNCLETYVPILDVDVIRCFFKSTLVVYYYSLRHYYCIVRVLEGEVLVDASDHGAS